MELLIVVLALSVLAIASVLAGADSRPGRRTASPAGLPVTPLVRGVRPSCCRISIDALARIVMIRSARWV